ncbi:M50 family metallopeptidase [Hymenobacter chitinivorans]|uniref:Peptidase M50-like protein n=1 Tax=Hymenobacter chitinivorans DSM 11115 TaxID=1121954 RepID=A0A2M9B936_9BACT|nr:M50 family metallopeptidase [Hymenobacter chitinivorans]PJJ54459.1 peptidase M50-like protein [Hymenobacter chitinivorans DSM 11115]
MLDFSKPDASSTTLQQAERKQRRLRLLVLGVLWGIALILGSRRWLHALLYQAAVLEVAWPVLVLGWVLGLGLLYLLLIAVHEGGHVLGARLARFRVLTFAVSWLRITRQAGGWQVRLQKPLASLGGMVQAYPAHTRHLRPRFALFIAGGPLANLLTGALALYLRQVLLPPTSELAFAVSRTQYGLNHALTFFGWASLFVGAFNLLPLRLKSGYTIDGRKLWYMARGGAAMHQHLGLLYFQSITYAGTRPRAWDPAQLEAFLAYRSHTVLDFYAHLYAYAYYQDCDERALMEEHLAAALERRHASPVALQQHVLAEAAVVAALSDEHAEYARQWLDQAQAAKPFSNEEGLFARAAVAYAEGQLPEATRWLQAARQQLQQASHLAANEQGAEQLDDLQHRIALAATAQPA